MRLALLGLALVTGSAMAEDACTVADSAPDVPGVEVKIGDAEALLCLSRAEYNDEVLAPRRELRECSAVRVAAESALLDAELARAEAEQDAERARRVRPWLVAGSFVLGAVFTGGLVVAVSR